MGASPTSIRVGVVLSLAALGLPIAGPVAAATLASAAVTAGSGRVDAPALILGTIRLGHHRLIRVPLDGVNEPQLLADVEGPADSEYAPQWSIAPDGRTALHT